MTDTEKATMVTAMSGEADANIVSAYLALAGDKVCRKAYPFNPTISVVPSQYDWMQVEIAVYLLNKRGAEGQTSHDENGIRRGYEAADVPPSLLRDIVPFAAPIGEVYENADA